MIVDCDLNLISMWRSIDEVVRYPQYKGGARDEQKPIYQNPLDSSSNPVLILDFDILNDFGYGLKRGYYEIATNEDFSALMFVQSGTIKAKIPVIKQERISEYGTNFEWENDRDKTIPDTASKNLQDGISVASKRIYKKTYDEKELKKRHKKYKKGQDPSTYFHSTVSMEYDKELDLYKIIWEKYNTRLIGVLKYR